METYSRLQSELHNARNRVTKFRQEAASDRLTRHEADTALWRRRLAAQLHSLADRIGPTHYSSKRELA